ncbi:hypothetical protein BN1013_01488 [Candidatus Rubidus massiliensis]|nr:MAG: hypothetical protein BGO10_04825 [Chlamydia sp. 32-24]CDZ80960.1 hypothetical protein BN1013_01488 [Candidatus Rubidus massiliensis]
MSSPTLDTQLVFFCQETTQQLPQTKQLDDLYQKKFHIMQQISFYQISTKNVDPHTGFIESKKKTVKLGHSRVQRHNRTNAIQPTHLTTISYNIEKLRKDLAAIDNDIYVLENSNV